MKWRRSGPVFVFARLPMMRPVRRYMPGETEIGVYLAMNAAIVQAYGAPVLFPGDFACGQRSIRGGGPPTDRVLAEGDLFPLDLFPAPALYFGDTCRTFCVGEPTPAQIESWQLACDALSLGESLIKPGAAGQGYLPRDQTVPR